MAFRFQKRIKILPGVRVNFSKRGISTTFGIKGASITKSKRGTHANVGIPGTGISYRKKISNPKSKENNFKTQKEIKPISKVVRNIYCTIGLILGFVFFLMSMISFLVGQILLGVVVLLMAIVFPLLIINSSNYRYRLNKKAPN